MKLHRKIAAAFGYELIKKRKLNDTLEQHLVNIIEALRVNCVIDVGANQGQYGAMLRRIGFQGRIVSFEPLPSAYKVLAEISSSDANWQAFNIALGAAEGTQNLNQYKSEDFSSFLAPTDYGSERFRWRVQVEDQIEVKIQALSNLAEALVQGLDNPRIFLKIDTQGYDLEVIKGAQKLMPHVSGIQSEISTKPIYKGMPHYLESLARFDTDGFDVTGLYPVTRCKESLAVIEYDCVMRRRAAV